MNKKLISALLFGALVPAGFALAAPVGSDDVNAGVELSRMQDYLEREMVERQIAEERQKARAEVEKKEEERQQHEREVSFLLNRLDIEESKVLTAEEIAGVKAAYEGKEVTLSDLYDAVAALNNLYESHGYFTCRAFLRPQKIEGGVVAVALAESTVGRVVLDGNKNTDEKYILNRLPLAEGSIPSMDKLNHDLLRFNGTNDAQLRIVLKAGEAEGTTDYYITVKEPKNSSWTLFTDNMGTSGTGEYRMGLFYNNRSLSGVRNPLIVGTVFSRGSRAFSAMYTHPVGRSGGKLNFSVNYNNVRQIKNTDVGRTKGRAYSFTLGYAQPICVSEKFRSEFTVDLRRQNSHSDWRPKSGGYDLRIVDDTVTDLSLGLAMTKMGDRYVFYRKHTLTYGHSSSLYDSQNFTMYKLSALYQKYYGNGSNFLVRLDGQYSFKDNVVSSRQFFLGGMYSVRGYPENYMSADSGISLNFEYGMPIAHSKKVRGFWFFDYGRLFGESGESNKKDRYLVSSGLGVRAQMGKNVSGTLSFGFPLKKNFSAKNDRVSPVRVNFIVTAQF